MELCLNKLPTPMSRREMLKMSGIGFGGVALNVFDVSENSKFDKTEVLLNGWYQDAEISEDRLGGGLNGF